MMERRTGQHQAVDMRYRNCYRRSLGRGPEHPARGRAVNVEPVRDTDVKRGNHVGLPAEGEADVANQRGIEDRVDGVAVIRGALGEALDAGARRRRDRVVVEIDRVRYVLCRLFHLSIPFVTVRNYERIGTISNSWRLKQPDLREHRKWNSQWNVECRRAAADGARAGHEAVR